MNPDAVLTLSVILLLIYAVAFVFSLRPAKKPQRFTAADMHQSLGRAGDSQRYYKPKRNWHRVINRIVGGEVAAFPPGAVIISRKKYPDVSFYQGLISWDTMRLKTDAVIIRAGQNTWEDSMFRTNYAAAKMRGMLRGIYWFYDDRVSPGAQAELLISLIKNDLPEMEIWCDWERKYGGQFGGLKNVVAFMQAIEREIPSARVGMYTGYFFFAENSNAILNLFQYQYLSKKPLWLAWYADMNVVKVPAPWTTLDLWQYGTPAEDWGQGSAEIDMNWFNGSITDFYARYKIAEPPQEETEEEPMAVSKWYRVTASAGLNIRRGPGTNYQDVGDLLFGDLIEVSETIGGWHHIITTRRSGFEVLTPDPAWCKDSYTVLTGSPVVTPPPDPEPEPVADPIVSGRLTLTRQSGATEEYTIGTFTRI